MEQSELNKILEQHKFWIDGRGGKRANLEGANLKDANLYGADLRDANLRDANLEGAHLRDAFFYRANLTGVDLTGANLTYTDMEEAILYGANLTHANLTGANLRDAILNCSIGLPDVSWIIPGCLVRLNRIKYNFYLYKEGKYDNFIQDSFGFIIQDNREEGTFDMLLGDRIIRNIPDWVKYSGLKQIESV